MDYYSAIKRNETPLHVRAQMNLEYTMPIEEVRHKRPHTA